MDYEKAMEILEFEPYERISSVDLKKRYHKLALQYHPDKNCGSEDSKQRFQMVNEAFEKLDAHLNSSFDAGFMSNSSCSPNREYSEPKDYQTLFQSFMESFVQNHDFPEMSIVKEIVLSGCKKLSLALFENMNKELALNTLSFLCRYKEVLHVDDETINSVKFIISKKYENDMVYILNPSLDDMLNNNVYKLKTEDKTYYVPLWHSEAYFDGPFGEIIVKCVPDLPDNMYIDEFNGIHLSLTRKFSVNLFDHPRVDFSIGKHKFEIPHIRFQKNKTYFLGNQGLPPINADDIYTVSEKAGIYVTLTFVD